MAKIKLTKVPFAGTPEQDAKLTEKLDELKAVNKRLVAYGDNVALLTKEKELLAAKIRIHDDMGKLLLATKRRLDEPLNETEQKQMICFWQAEIAALKSTRPRTKKDNLQVIKDAAKLVDVTVEFRGEKPKADTVNEKILIAAMHECLTNTVSHANGKTMTVTASEKNGKSTIKVTNDGEKPKGKITEGSGLSSLRRRIEASGGEMLTAHSPRFALLLNLPGTEEYI